jgi:outer membrane lipoprotein
MAIRKEGKIMSTQTESAKSHLGIRKPHAISPTKPRCTLIVGIAILGLSGCKTYDVIPDQLVSQVEADLTYEIVRKAPHEHQGKLVVWGGEVLAGKRTKEGTRLEILQLPLTDALHPTEARVRSKGRFIAIDNEGTITDPAVIEPGTPVTIIGRIGPAQREELQGIEYTYLRLDILDMTIWEKRVMRTWRYLGGWGWRYDARPRTLYRSYRID